MAKVSFEAGSSRGWHYEVSEINCKGAVLSRDGTTSPNPTQRKVIQPPCGCFYTSLAVVAKPHFPCIGWLASYSRTPDLSRADQLSVASCLSRGSRRAPDSDGASRGPIWPSANRRSRRTNFHRERPKNSRCFLAPQTEARPFPYPDTQLRNPHNAARP